MAANHVRDIMTPDPVCILATDSVLLAAQTMRDENVGSVPVISDQQRRGLTGIVTDRDLVLQVLAEGRDPQNTTVQSVMTVDPVSCHEGDDLNQVIKMMANEQIRRLPVVDENNSVIGIIAQADLVTRVDLPNKTGDMLEQISQPTDQ